MMSEQVDSSKVSAQCRAVVYYPASLWLQELKASQSADSVALEKDLCVPTWKLAPEVIASVSVHFIVVSDEGLLLIVLVVESVHLRYDAFYYERLKV